MQAGEVVALGERHPDLLERALAIEDNAQTKLEARRAEGKPAIRGLARNRTWRELLVVAAQPKLPCFD